MILATVLGAFAGRAPEAFDELDRMLNLRNEYLDSRQKRIDNLALKRHNNPDSTALTLELAEAFIGFENDSAIVYLTRGIESSSGADKMKFIWIRSSLLPLAGFFQQAEDNIVLNNWEE